MDNSKKVKSCKLCHKIRFGSSSWCRLHFYQREREKKEKKKERKLKSKRFQISERKKLHKKCWRLISEFIRRKDADFNGFVSCFTCGKKSHWKEMNAGHWRHGVLDLDERNIKSQCAKCNLFLSGRLDVYTMKLIDLHDKEYVRKLGIDADRHQGYALEELKILYLILKKKVSNLTI